MRKIIAAVAPILVVTNLFAAPPVEQWKVYRDEKNHFSFRYPDNLELIRATTSATIASVELKDNACPIVRVTVLDVKKSHITLPDRYYHFPYFDVKKQMWIGSNDDVVTEHPVCLEPDVLKSGVTAYAHGDSIHGWWSQVVLTNQSTAIIVSDPQFDADECSEEGHDMTVLIAETLELDGNIKSIEAKCP